jgi:hypothetical protein
MRGGALAAVLCAAAAALGGCGGSPGASARATSAPPRAHRGAVPGRLSILVPAGWRLRRPPLTALTEPTERLLLTSGPAPRGGNCGPDAAEARLPAGGALLYLFEYRSRGGPAGNGPRRSAFPPRPAHARLRARDLGHYECWHIPSYLLRFRSAGRAFQLHVAFGLRASAARRTEVLRVVDSLRIAPNPAPKRPPVTTGQLEQALRANPNEEASAASCRRATPADRRAARWAFGPTRRPLFVCRITFPRVPAATYAVVLTSGRCFASASRESRHGDYGCVRP